MFPTFVILSAVLLGGGLIHTTEHYKTNHVEYNMEPTVYDNSQ